MTYISSATTYDRNEVIIWERCEDGRRIQKRFEAPYYFFVEDKNGPFLDIFNKKLKQLIFNDYNSFAASVQNFKNSGTKIYESDISPEYKVLSREYFGKTPGRLNTTFFDIETDYDPAKGFAKPENPYAPINAIAIYHQHLDKMIVYAVPPNKKWTQADIPKELTDLAEIVLCKDEKHLLMHLLEEFEDSDILSGWNSEGYDVPYIFERVKRVLGQRSANRLSFKDARPPKYKEVKAKHGRIENVLQIFGRIHVDYMQLVGKFEPGERDSMALEAIAEDVLPGLEKLTYEGSLADLYNNDFLYFLRYNIRDCEILKGLDEKKGFMALAVILSHMDASQIQDVLGTVKLTELSIINYCHYTLSKRVPDTDKDLDPNEGKFEGASVLHPQCGLHEWPASIDVRSLYPSAMRTINISPEMLIGQFTNNAADFISIKNNSKKELTVEFSSGEFETRSVEEWKELLRSNNYAISGYGTIFNQNVQGFIPALLTQWFNQRKDYQRKAAEAEKEYLKLKAEGLDYKEIEDRYKYYDKIQNIFKLKLNSTYGACGNRFFKFYDIRLAESTTKTGREVLFHMARKLGEILEKKYEYPNDCVIYGDTDSSYFKTYTDNLEDAFYVANYVTKTINLSFPEFCKNTFFVSDENSKLLAVSQELVANKGIFTAGKKNYMLRVLKKDGNDVDFIKVTGLSIKKTTTPKPVRVKLTKYMEEFLKGESWDTTGIKFLKLREELKKSSDVTLLGLPKNVNNVEDYVSRFNAKEPGLRVPGHVTASMMWNKCLHEYGDTESWPIVSGMKIRVLYLGKKVGGFSNIAMPVDLKIIPPWFNEHFMPLIDKEKQVVRLVDKPMKPLLGAIQQTIPTRKTLMIEDLFS